MCLIQFLGSPLGQSVATLIAAFMGVIGGIVGGFWINRRTLRKERIAHCKRLLQYLLSSLENNKERIDYLSTTLLKEQGYIPSYHMDTLPLEATASLRYNIIDDVSLNTLLDDIRWLFDNLNVKIDMIRESLSGGLDMRSVLVKMINETVMPALKCKYDKAVSLIKSELSD